MRRRTLGILAGVGAAVLIAGGLSVWWAVSRTPTLEDAANTYLAALADGDLDTITAMRDQQLGADTERIIAEAFRAADSYISAPRVDELHPDGSVRATVTLGGEAATIGFVLSRANGRWVLSGDYLATLEASTTIGDSVQIGDALLPAETPVPLLPAAYTVRASPAGLLTGDARVALSNERSERVSVEASVDPAATGLAQAQVDDYADACAETATSVPENCGLRVPWAADLAELSSISFRIEQYPEVALSADGTAFAATGGVIVATASGTTRAGAAAAFTYRDEDWALRGSVTFRGAEMLLSVW